MTEKKAAKTAAPKAKTKVSAKKAKAESVTEFDAKAIKEINADEKKAVKKIKKTEKAESKTGQLGRVSQVLGAVVDVKFDNVDDSIFIEPDASKYLTEEQAMEKYLLKKDI